MDLFDDKNFGKSPFSGRLPGFGNQSFGLEKTVNRTFRYALLGVLFQITVWLFVVGTIVAVAWHFLAKFW